MYVVHFKLLLFCHVLFANGVLPNCLVAYLFLFNEIKKKCASKLFITLISFNSTTVPLNGGSGGNLGFNAYYFNVSGTFFLTVEQTEIASNLCRHLLKVKKKSKGINIR